MVKIENMKKIEKKVGFSRGRGGTSKSCVKIKKNIPDKDIEKYLISKEEETPKIIIFADGDNIEMINIIGDGIVVNIERIQFGRSHCLLLCLQFGIPKTI